MIYPLCSTHLLLAAQVYCIEAPTFVTGRAEFRIPSQAAHHHCVDIPYTRLVVALVLVALLTTQLLCSETNLRRKAITPPFLTISY